MPRIILGGAEPGSEESRLLLAMYHPEAHIGAPEWAARRYQRDVFYQRRPRFIGSAQWPKDVTVKPRRMR